MDRFVTGIPPNRTAEQGASSLLSSGSEDEYVEPSSSRAQYRRKFRSQWLEMFVWISEKDEKAFCAICNKSLFNIITHIKRHETSPLHRKNYATKRNQTHIDQAMATAKDNILQEQVKSAELNLIMFVLLHHMPDLPAKSFPDSNFFGHIAKRVDEFSEFQNYVGVKNHKIFRVSNVRWLSLKQVVDRLLSQWSALQLFFISCFDDGVNQGTLN
ncbi:PREDICTED: uncharacterized protein LOC108369627, partial [Rhagoletis zephyria]